MKILENVSLAQYSTMRLGGDARYAAEISSKADLLEALEFANKQKIAVIMIGEGSNIIWSDTGFPGLVLINKVRGFDIDSTSKLTCGAGEEWDSVVERSVTKGYSGIEQLSFIPGTAGGTPVQNVGAYGREIKDVFVSLEAYDNLQKEFVTLHKKDCHFGYRTSRFKAQDRGRFFITFLTLQLSTKNPRPPFYDTLQKYFDEHDISKFTPQVVRDAVIAVRTNRLPDPNEIANNGSFFANPIISMRMLKSLLEQHPGLAHWQMPNDKAKVSAAWLVEHAGFPKDTHDKATGMATWKHHSLVLVNETATKTEDLLKFKQKIVDAVQSKFGITLEQEPELI